MKSNDLKISEFARQASVAEITIRRRVISGGIRARKDVLGRWRIPLKELRRFRRPLKTEEA